MSDTSLSINNNFASSLGSDVSVGSLKKANLSAFDEDFPPGTPQREEMIDLLKEFGISTDPSSLSNLTKNRCDDLKNTMGQLEITAKAIDASTATPEQKKQSMQKAMDLAFNRINSALSTLPGYQPISEADFSTTIQNDDSLIQKLLNPK